MKRINFLFVLVAIVSFLSLVVACDKTPTTWLDDYEAGMELAKSQKKDVLLFVTGEDWDGRSTDLKTRIFGTSSFIEKAGKDFVLVQLDFSNSLYEGLELSEDATEEEKAAVAEKEALLEKNATIAMDLNATSMALPVVMLLTSDGYVYTVIENVDKFSTEESYLDYILAQKKTGEKITNLLKEVDSKEGVEKAKIIDELYETIPATHRYLVSDYAVQVPELDPENETGVVGKYEIVLAYTDAINLINANDPEGAINVFLEVIEKGHLTEEETQEMYYQIAYFYNLQGEAYLDELLKYLELAISIAPESQVAKEVIQPTYDSFIQLKNEQGLVTE